MPPENIILSSHKVLKHFGLEPIYDSNDCQEPNSHFKDRICRNLLEACIHAYKCNEIGQNRRILILLSKKLMHELNSMKLDSTSNSEMDQCWKGFIEAMEELRKRYGTVYEVIYIN